MSTTTRETKEATSISGVTVPDSKRAREARCCSTTRLVCITLARLQEKERD